MTASPIPISTKRVTSRKMPGIRWRHVPCGAPSNMVALSPDSSSTNTTKPNTVARTRTDVNCADIRATLTSSTNRAPKGIT